MSHLKRLGSLWTRLTYNSQLSQYVLDEDRKVFARRTEAEGLTFLTVTLPKISKAMLTGFSTGTLRCADLSGWALKKGRVYPRFLHRAWDVLFTQEGNLRATAQDPNTDAETSLREAGAVVCLRQLSELFYKLEVEPTDELTVQALQGFVETEEEVRTQFDWYYSSQVRIDPALYKASDGITPMDLAYPIAPRALKEQLATHLGCQPYQDEMATNAFLVGRSFDYECVLKEAQRLVHRLVGGVNPLSIMPRHGSGASACRVVPHKRYNSFRYIPRLNALFPYEKYFHYNSSHFCDDLAKYLGSEEAEPSARVVLVPKDSRGPRVISCEPREFMFIQQGLNALLLRTVRSNPTVAAQVDWLDQSRNRDMACEGSKDPSLYATLDLKEASDRLSWELVQYLFPSSWVDALGASRSLATVLPEVSDPTLSGRKVPLTKFAPMGSACCFPVESLCFWAITSAACGNRVEQYFPDDRISRIPRQDITSPAPISVYGDDIICPTEKALWVNRCLQLAGLVVNEKKSFMASDIPFRESCGGDFWKGIDVSPVRCKHLPTDDRPGRHRICDTVNNLIHKYGDGIDVLGLIPLYEEWYGPTPKSNRFESREGELVTHFGGALALISPTTSVPSSYKKRLHRRDRRKPNLCRVEYRVPYESPKDYKILLDCWGQLLRKSLILKGPELPADRGAAPRVSYTWRWSAL